MAIRLEVSFNCITNILEIGNDKNKQAYVKPFLDGCDKVDYVVYFGVLNNQY